MTFLSAKYATIISVATHESCSVPSVLPYTNEDESSVIPARKRKTNFEFNRKVVLSSLHKQELLSFRNRRRWEEGLEFLDGNIDPLWKACVSFTPRNTAAVCTYLLVIGCKLPVFRSLLLSGL
jgi:hypothetical protein